MRSDLKHVTSPSGAAERDLAYTVGSCVARYTVGAEEPGMSDAQGVLVLLGQVEFVDTVAQLQEELVGRVVEL